MDNPVDREKDEAINRILYGDVGGDARARLEERRKRREAAKAAAPSRGLFAREPLKPAETPEYAPAPGGAGIPAEPRYAPPERPAAVSYASDTRTGNAAGIGGDSAAPPPEREIPKQRDFSNFVFGENADDRRRATMAEEAAAPASAETAFPVDSTFALHVDEEEKTLFAIDKKNEAFQELLDEEYRRKQERDAELERMRSQAGIDLSPKPSAAVIPEPQAPAYTEGLTWLDQDHAAAMDDQIDTWRTVFEEQETREFHAEGAIATEAEHIDHVSETPDWLRELEALSAGTYGSASQPMRQPAAVPSAPEPEYVAPVPQPEYVVPAPAPQPEYVAPAPAPEYVVPAPAPEYVAPAPQPEYVVPAPVPQPEYVTPASAPEYVVPAPVPVIPEPVAPAPEYTAPVPAPEYVVPAPVPVIPEPVAPAPGYTASTPAPEYVVPAPVPVIPEPIAAAPEYTAPAPAPEYVVPAPAPVIPEPVAPAPEYVAPAPEPVIPTPIAPAPEYTAPVPASVIPELVAPAPEPEPEYTAPVPAPVIPEPIAAAPEYVAPAPEYTAPAPAPEYVVPAPVPVIPEPVAPEPEYVAPVPAPAPEPEYVTPVPAPVIPESVAPAPEYAAPEPVTVPEPEPIAAPEPEPVIPEPTAEAPEPALPRETSYFGAAAPTREQVAEFINQPVRFPFDDDRTKKTEPAAEPVVAAPEPEPVALADHSAVEAPTAAIPFFAALVGDEVDRATPEVSPAPAAEPAVETPVAIAKTTEPGDKVATQPVREPAFQYVSKPQDVPVEQPLEFGAGDIPFTLDQLESDKLEESAFAELPDWMRPRTPEPVPAAIPAEQSADSLWDVASDKVGKNADVTAAAVSAQTDAVALGKTATETGAPDSAHAINDASLATAGAAAAAAALAGETTAIAKTPEHQPAPQKRRKAESESDAGRTALSVVITILIVLLVLVIVSILILHFKPDSTLAYYIRDGIQMITTKLGIGS